MTAPVYARTHARTHRCTHERTRAPHARTYAPTHVPSVPQVKTIMSSGAACPTIVKRGINEMFGAVLYELYGVRLDFSL